MYAFKGRAKKNFVYKTFHTFLLTVKEALNEADPNHLNLGIRFSDPLTLPDELLRISGEVFDVFCFNCYLLKPTEAMLNRVHDFVHKPAIIGYRSTHSKGVIHQVPHLYIFNKITHMRWKIALYVNQRI